MSAGSDVRDRLERLERDLGAALIDSSVEVDRPLGELTTYRVGGDARLFVDVRSLGDLERLALAVAASTVPVAVIGRGSNLLVADSGFEGLALRLGDAFATVEISPPMVMAGGAASLPVVARRTVAAGLTGFEWAVGVPGSIGGAVRMNAGGHGSDMSACVRSARVVDLGHGGSRVVSWVDLNFGYRTSSIAPNEVVVSAELKLDPGSVESGEEALAEIVRWRRDNQPGGQNAGSVFTNPVGDSAGRLIDAAGCKGLRHGSAEVSVKHANFIQCDAEGRSGDVLALMSLVRARVEERFGVALEPETRLLGFDEVPEWAVSAVVTTTTGMGAAE